MPGQADPSFSPAASAPDFSLTDTDLGAVRSDQFRDKPLLLNIFPSIDTPV